MRLSFFRLGALRFSNRYCYATHTSTYTGITYEKNRPSTLTAARFTQATIALSTLSNGGLKIHYNASGISVRMEGESADQYTHFIGPANKSVDGLLGNKKQASADMTYGLPHRLIDSTSSQPPRRRVWDALQQKLPHELFAAVLDASQDQGYLKALPSTTFIGILEVLHPRHFVADFRTIYQDLHPSQVEALGASQLHEIFAEYTSKIREIAARRLRARGDLGIEEWKWLLQWVAWLGDGSTALDIWTDMVNRKIEPDLVCYNLYLEARCWSGAYFPIERNRLRVTPKNLHLRRLRKNGLSHLQRLRGFQVGPGGLKDEVTRMFAVMVNRGIMADAKTFGLLMIALSRDRDLQGVKSVLKKVWDVDVDSISEGDQSSEEPINLPSGSPLHPTADTLYFIAHIFGSNNELPTALRIVDFISRKYSISVQPRVWDELLEWAHVLSSRRRAVRREDGTSHGQLPLESVESLWNTMVSAPYNIRPNMRMYNYYCSNMFNRQMLDAMLYQMRAGLALYWSQAAEYEQLRCLRGITLAHSSEYCNGRNLADISFAQQEIALAALTEYRNFLMISRWFRLLLGGRRWCGESDRVMLWERQELPNAIREFWHFRPRPVIRYHIITGKVEILTDEDQDSTGRRPQRAFGAGHFDRFDNEVEEKAS